MYLKINIFRSILLIQNNVIHNVIHEIKKYIDNYIQGKKKPEFM